MKKIFAELNAFRPELLCVLVSVAAGVGATLGLPTYLSAVSYTHLDVYKRQGCNGTDIQERGHVIQNIPAEHDRYFVYGLCAQAV